MSIWTYCLDLIVHQAYCVYERIIDTQNIKEIVQELHGDDENVQEELSDDDNSLSDSKLSFKEFKRTICEQLVQPHLLQKEQRRNNNHAPSASTTVTALMDSSIGCQMQHVLVENKCINGINQISCFLCSMVHNDGKRRTSKYGCIVCEKGFHVNYFAAYHYRKALEGRAGTIRTLIETIERTKLEDKKTPRKCKSAKIESLDNLNLP
jgi:hypothetical protein